MLTSPFFLAFEEVDWYEEASEADEVLIFVYDDLNTEFDLLLQLLDSIGGSTGDAVVFVFSTMSFGFIETELIG